MCLYQFITVIVITVISFGNVWIKVFCADSEKNYLDGFGWFLFTLSESDAKKRFLKILHLTGFKQYLQVAPILNYKVVT